MHAREKKVEVSEMMYLRNIFGTRRVDRVRNGIIRENCGCELSVLERIERNVLNWFGHAERMGEWKRKGYLREYIGQMWRVAGGEGDRREGGGMKRKICCWGEDRTKGRE